MAQRLRSSEIVVFCAFALFCLAWLPLGLAHDPLPDWRAAASGQPVLLVALVVLGVAYLIASVAILIGGVPLLASALIQAITTHRWGQLALFGVPLLAGAALIALKLADIPWSSESQTGAIQMQQPMALQIGLILAPVVAFGVSVAAIATAVGRAEAGLEKFRFALLPAGVATSALILGLVAAITITALVLASSPLPPVGAWPPLLLGGVVLMLLAAGIAGVSLRHAIQAAHVEA